MIAPKLGPAPKIQGQNVYIELYTSGWHLDKNEKHGDAVAQLGPLFAQPIMIARDNCLAPL